MKQVFAVIASGAVRDVRSSLFGLGVEMPGILRVFWQDSRGVFTPAAMLIFLVPDNGAETAAKAIIRCGQSGRIFICPIGADLGSLAV